MLKQSSFSNGQYVANGHKAPNILHETKMETFFLFTNKNK